MPELVRLFCCYPSCCVSFWVPEEEREAVVVCPYCQRSSKLCPYPCKEERE